MAALDDETELLNEALTRAEGKIATMKLGVSASVPLADHWALYWGRFQGGWGLGIVQRDDSITPILKASRESRILAAGKIPDLIEALRQAVVTQTEQARAARMGLDDWLDRLDMSPEPKP